MIVDDNWFTEVSEGSGSAFSLKITEKLHDEKTAYQRIEIFATEKYGRLMVIDGYIMFSGRDNFIYHEMMTHPVLLSHPDPRHVAIIGGGDCGSLQQVLIHPEVESVVQIDIDRRVTELAQQFFPELCRSNHDPRASLRFEDGIVWMQHVAAASIDVIIVDSTDPVGPAEGLFSEDFYRACYIALKPQGLLVQQSESPLIHQEILTRMTSAMRSAGFAVTSTLHFPQSVYPSGWWSATIAAKHAEPLLFRRPPAANMRYYSSEVHRSALVQMPFLKGVTY